MGKDKKKLLGEIKIIDNWNATIKLQSVLEPPKDSIVKKKKIKRAKSGGWIFKAPLNCRWKNNEKRCKQLSLRWISGTEAIIKYIIRGKHSRM